MIKIPYRHFVWDFDGMMFASYDHTTRAALNTLHDFGMEGKWQEVYDALRVSVGTMCRQYGFTEPMRRRLYEYENNMEMEPITTPYPGIPEIVRRIAEEGGQNYLLTNRDKMGEVYLEKYGMRQYFRDIVDSTFGFPRKPDPTGMRYLKDKHGFGQDVLMLGDRELDIEAGLGGGADGCFFDEFRKNTYTKAKYRVYTIEQLYQLIFNEELRINDK